ncbi:hypothetical protein PM082_004450 [Marasmius tenuissimus]|nr:hypothetical protein PM082_004450 [Marasmius tenuissimus]
MRQANLFGRAHSASLSVEPQSTSVDSSVVQPKSNTFTAHNLLLNAVLLLATVGYPASGSKSYSSNLLDLHAFSRLGITQGGCITQAAMACWRETLA